MPNPTSDLSNRSLLRFEAETRLKNGTTPYSKGWTLNSETLTLLFKFASDPEKAGDALKLLHELQTHQVELDLQHEQLETNERELADSLNHYKILYDYAPVGYLIVSPEGRIIESNLTAARLFGVTRDELVNSTVDRFLIPDSRPMLDRLLNKTGEEGTTVSCAVQSANHENGPPYLLRITANKSPYGEAILMIVNGHNGSM